MDTTETSRSTWGVTLAIAGIVSTILLAIALSFVALYTWREDLPISFMLYAAIASVVAGAQVWSWWLFLRLQVRPATPRVAPDGTMVLRIPDAMRPVMVLTTVGAWLIVLSGLFVIAAIATDTPALSTAVRRAGVMVLATLWLGLVAWATVATRLFSARFEAAADGMRWESLWHRGGRISWRDVASVAFRRRGVMRGTVEVTTHDGKSHGIPIWDPSVPLSRRSSESLTAELESARRRATAE